MDEMVRHNLTQDGKNLTVMAVSYIKITGKRVETGSPPPPFIVAIISNGNHISINIAIIFVKYILKATVVSMVEIVMAEVVASLERVEEIMTDGPIPQRIGQFRYHGTKESKLNCSVN